MRFTFFFALCASLLLATAMPLQAHAQDADTPAAVSDTSPEAASDVTASTDPNAVPAEPGSPHLDAMEVSEEEDPTIAEIAEEKRKKARQLAPANEQLAIVNAFEHGFTSVVDAMNAVLFYPVFGFPLLVAWLIFGGVFFTLRLNFVNLRLFCHGWSVAFGRYAHKDNPGEVSAFASLSAALSGTVGLGNIAGVAVAVTMGGPGAVIWMMLAGFLGMSTKYAEVYLGHKYRRIDETGKVRGGPFYYLQDGLKEIGKAKLGRFLAIVFAILCLGGTFGGGNMFQANQTIAALTNTFSLQQIDWVLALVMAIAVGIVLIGGVKRIATVAEFIVPLMAVIYLGAGIVVLWVNADALADAVSFMFASAFGVEAVGGGIMGAIINGFRRSAFSNESGVGSAPIVMSASTSNEPVQTGAVATLLPFIDTIIICFLTGMIITVTGVYEDTTADGVVLTARSFATVIDWFPTLLSVAVALFAFSTMITWSYYGERAWDYLFGHKTISLYHIIFCAAVFFGGLINFGVIIDFSDLLLLSMAVPNLIGMYLLHNVIKDDLSHYLARRRAGEIKPVPRTKRADLVP